MSTSISEPSGQGQTQTQDYICRSSENFKTSTTQGRVDQCLATLLHENTTTGEKTVLPIRASKPLHVGREPDCELAIDDMLISKHQFRIYSIIYESEQLDEYPPLIYCEDLESRNGTYVNDMLIGIMGNTRKGHLLTDGDTIEIRPHWKFHFRQPNSFRPPRNSLPKPDLEYFGDHFTISDRILGGGISGDVFLAHETGTSKQLACKVVKSSALIRKQSRIRIAKQVDLEAERLTQLREVEILSKLDHPNIISIRKAFISADRLYMFTELAAAGDLYAYLESHGRRLEDVHARLITRQIALALEHLHDNGIAHRDIKLENVLLTNLDVGSRVILTDFGLANYTDQKTGRLFSMVGTEGYAAPEIIDVGNNRGYTLAADMWSFGMLTWALLTGETSIPRSTLSQFEDEAAEVAKKFVSADDRSAAREWSFLSSRVRDFLRRLLTAPGNRMTAVQTVNHSWYKKPPREAQAMEDAYGRVIKLWKPRAISEDILEHLTCDTLTTNAAPRSRKRVPDASSSPYFNLDRHLIARSPSKRRKILEELANSGASFIGTQPNTQDMATNHETQSQRTRTTSGKDIFSRSIERMGSDSYSRAPFSQPQSESQTEIVAGTSLNSDDRKTTIRKSGTRKETDPEDQEIHNTAAKQLPKYCPARFFKDQISEVKRKKIGAI